MTSEEKNIAIAEFMGIEIYDSSDPKCDGEWGDFQLNELQYNTDWNWPKEP